MISLRLLIEYGAYPLWIYDEKDGGVIDTVLPDEWADDVELSDMLDSIQEQYEALFINNEKEFSFVGFKNRESEAAFVKLVSEAVKRVIEKNNGKYVLRNDIDAKFFEGLYTGEE